MIFVAPKAEWYIAEILMLIRVANASRGDLEKQYVLIKAKDPDEAYEKSLDYGKRQSIDFINTDQKQVVMTFLGLHDLNMVYEPLEDGAEILSKLFVNRTPSQVAIEITAKHKLGIFAPAAKTLASKPAESVEPETSE